MNRLVCAAPHARLHWACASADSARWEASRAVSMSTHASAGSVSRTGPREDTMSAFHSQTERTDTRYSPIT